MARLCQKELEEKVAKSWEVDVMPGKANLEVRPTFINKGEIVKRLVQMYHNRASDGEPRKIEFVLCLGDDFTDEDMFRSLNGLSGPVLNPDHVFTVTVGASTKVTLGRWHLLEPEDVVNVAALLAGVDKVESITGIGEVNLAALSLVEGKVPDMAAA